LSVGREPESGCLVPDFNKRLAELLQHVYSDVVDKCKSLVAPRRDPLQYTTKSEVEQLDENWQPVHQLREHVKKLKSQIPSLCTIMSLNPSDLVPQSADWDEELFRMLQDAEADLCRSLQSYARACHDRCLSSLAAEPKPLANDIVNFLNTLIFCENLDQFLASAGPDEGAAGTQTFAEQRKSVRDAVKQKFIEVRDAFSRDVRADKMAAAQASLEWASEMRPLRHEFADDAITFDAALQEMKGSFEQRAGTFARKFDNALSQERFPEIRKLLLGYRDLKGAAEQEEYSSAFSKLIEVGDGKYKAAIQIMRQFRSSMINHDARGRTGDFPPSVEQVATSLRWIESARCLSVGDDPILPVEVFEKWQSAFHHMTLKLESLVGETETKLDEWKFATVEEIHRRLGQLLMLRFPVEIAGTIERMQSELSAALDAKVVGLDNDVRNALEKGEYTEFDDIFQQIQIARDAESSFVKRKTYTSVHGVMEDYLNDLVESIRGHYTNFEIKEAYSKHQQLRNLKRSQVVRTHVEDTGLDTLAEQKKKSMITRSWLSEGDVHIVKKKVNGFRDVDVGNYDKLVREFMESFKADTTRLAKVESRRAVLEVRDLVRQITRFAEFLDDQLSALKTGWDDIWNSFFESVDRNVRLAIAAGQGHDISDSRSFLEEARKLLQQHATGQWPKAGRNKAKRASTGGKSKGPGVHENNEHGRGGVTGTALFDSLTPGGGIGDDANAEDNDDFFDAEEDNFFDAEKEEQKRAFSLPFDNFHFEKLMTRLDIVLGLMEVDTDQIGADWAQHVENFDCKAEGRSFVETLNFIRQLKRQAQAIRTCGEYGWGKPTPTPARAVRKVLFSVAEQIKALDASRPEECAIFLQNVVRFDQECNRVVDDDSELQQQISNNIKKYSQEVREWVVAVTKDFTEKSTEKYRQALLEHSPEKRRALLHEVAKIIDQHELLEEKLVERGLKQNNGTDSPLVAQIKSEISGKTERTLQRLRACNCTVEDVAGSIHEIYVTAMDLGITAIFKHSENCIASILQDCRGKSGMGLTELGSVLERDFPQGSEIVNNMPQFAELNRLAFQKMTSGNQIWLQSELAAKMQKRTQEEHAGTVGAVKESADCKSRQPLFKSYESRVSVDFRSFERSQSIHLQDVQPWWEEPDPKKDSDGSAKMRESPQEQHAGTVGAVKERADCKSRQTLFESNKSRVSVDFHSFERSQAIHLQVEEILNGEVLREAYDFADLISPVFRVVLQGASGGKVPDGQTVDLIVELEDVEDKLNTDSLVFIKKSEEPDGMWCGVSGGTFDLVPSEREKGRLLRGRVTTDSFSLWGVAKCHVKVAAHHIESDGKRKLRFIVYSGAPVGSYPIPRNTYEVRKDPASSRNTLVPMLRGFFMYQHSQVREEVVLRDGLEFTIQVQGKKDGVVKSSSEKSKWVHKRSIDWQKVEIDVHDIDLDSELEVNISRKSMGWVNRSRDGIREFTLKRQNRNVLPREWETCTSLGYWCNLDEYTGPQKSITCGYCLRCNEAIIEVFVPGLEGAQIKLGGCCEIVQHELMGKSAIASSAFVVSNVVSAAAIIERPVVGGQTSAQLASTDSTTTREVLNSTPARDMRRLPRIAGFFCKKTVDKKELLRTIKASEHVAQAEKEVAKAVEGIDPLKEAQELMSHLQRSQSNFEVDVYAQPSFKSFSDSLLSALERNVRALLFSGHGQSHCGFLWLKDKVSAEYEEIEPDRFVKLFPPVAAGAGGTIECVVLNACETEGIGKKLRKAGVPHVVCWRSEVDDTTANEFAVNFFTALDQSDVTKGMDYKYAFEQAVARMDRGAGAARAAMKHLAASAVDYVCLLSQDGDKFPDTGYIG
jgi:hypothetical protein